MFCSLATAILEYHMFKSLSTTFFIFLSLFFLICLSSSATCYILPSQFGIVNIIFAFYTFRTILTIQIQKQHSLHYFQLKKATFSYHIEPLLFLILQSNLRPFFSFSVEFQKSTLLTRSIQIQQSFELLHFHLIKSLKIQFQIPLPWIR